MNTLLGLDYWVRSTALNMASSGWRGIHRVSDFVFVLMQLLFYDSPVDELTSLRIGTLSIVLAM